MKKIEIHSANGNVITVVETPKAEQYTRELIETLLGRKLKPGEQIVFNS